MYRIYKPIDSDTTYAIKLCTGGAHIFDQSNRKHTVLSGEYETIHLALGIYLLRQMKVNDGWCELSRGIFDCT